MKHVSIRRVLASLLALLLAALTTIPALAEEAAAPDTQAVIEWAKGLGIEGQALKKSAASDAAMKFAADASLSANAASTGTAVDWHFGFIQTPFTEETTYIQIGTVLMIENEYAVLATDNAAYMPLFDTGFEDVGDAIASVSTVLMPDGQGGTYEFYPSGVYFSSRLPLMYVIMEFDTDLGVQYANDPSGLVQNCAGYYRNPQTDEIGVAGDKLNPTDTLRYGLDSGEPYMPGSPIYPADPDAGRYDTPAIGIQASDGYVYAAFQALESLIAELGEESEPTPEPTPDPTEAPTAEPTAKLTPEPVVAADVTDVPTAEPTDAPTDTPTVEPTAEPTDAPAAATEPTDAPTSEPESEPMPRPRRSIKSMLDDDEFIYPACAILAVIAIVVIFRKRKKAVAKKSATQMPAAPITPVAQVVEKTAPANATVAAPAVEFQRPASRVSIQCVTGTLAGAKFPLNSPVSIGRDKLRCGIIYPANEPGISGLHCSVAPDGNAVILKDEGSTNGTFVSGRRLSAGNPVRLRNGDTFTLAGAKNTFRVTVD